MYIEPSSSKCNFKLGVFILYDHAFESVCNRLKSRGACLVLSPPDYAVHLMSFNWQVSVSFAPFWPQNVLDGLSLVDKSPSSFISKG